MSAATNYRTRFCITCQFITEMTKRALLPGTVIQGGKYKIFRKLGSGTFGEVYEAAVLPEEKTLVAIKVASAARHNEHALRELEILRALQKSGTGLVVGLLDSFEMVIEGESRVCMVLEKLDQSLHQILTKRKEGFSLSEVAVLGSQLLTVLHHFDSVGLLHLDLKPANVLINLRDHQLRIADFGSACYLSQQTHSVAQTAAYRAPEVTLGLLPYSHAADMWSLGCILAELYCRFRVKGPGSHLHQLVRCFGLLPADMFASGRADCSYNELRLLSEFSQEQRCFDRLREAWRTKPRDKSAELFPLFCNLLAHIFQFHPEQRLDVQGALQHSFFREALKISREVNLEFTEPPWPAHLFPTSSGAGAVQRRPRRSSVRGQKRTAESTPPSSGSSRHGTGSSLFSSESDHTQD